MAMPRQPGEAGSESAWPLARDVCSFVLGAFILLHQTVWVETAQPWLITAGYACLGLAGSGRVQRWLSQRMENGNGEKK